MKGLSGLSLSVVLVIASLLTACGPTASPTAAPAATTAPQAAKPTTPPAPTTGAAAPSAVAPAPTKPAVATTSIKIGAIQSLTGSLANTGKDNQDGFDLYMDKINWTVAGRKLEKVVEDDAGTPDLGLTKIRKLAESDKVNIVAGLQSTAVCNALAPYVRDNKVVTIITGNCGAETLTKDPALRSPYLWRTTQTSGMFGYALSAWLVKNNYKNVVVVMSDYSGGYEVEDGFARAFIGEGGTIVQELYPALGTTDFGPFLAQVKADANAVVSFVVGADGLRFAQQYAEYGWKGKLQLFDLSSVIVSGPNVAELKDAAVGIIASIHYATDTDTAENKEFLAAFRAKYPGRLLAHDVAAGYSGAMILEAALKGAGGDVENKDKFLEALKKVDIKTPKGHFKFDENQNVVEDFYIKRIDKVGNEYVEKTLAVVPDISQWFKWKPDEVIKYPWGKMKGKYANINNAQLQELLKPYLQ
ncbi:MAG: ABC transporter substrate-binding protein [Dehalococcoidia bacterium]|nr:ABC transporter substrate-binding protein [Dehalococcoidia bacterium]